MTNSASSEHPVDSRLSDAEVEVRVSIPASIARRMIGPWYLVKKPESDIVRAAFRQALADTETEP